MTQSALLVRQIDAAVGRGVLRRFEQIDSASGVDGEYDPTDHVVRIPQRLLMRPAQTAFVLGHEVQHALNSPAVDLSTSGFYASLRRTADTTLNYTPAIASVIERSRWDEASANLAGWNTLVDFLRRPDRPLQLREILRPAPDATKAFVEDGFLPQIDPALTPNPDLTFNLSVENIEAMARRFFDAPTSRPGIDELDAFDYTNYYGGWAVAVAVEEHNRRHCGQLMRIDLASLHLSEESMAQNGLQLSVSQQRYVDGSTQPPSYGILHNTGTDPHASPSIQHAELARYFEAARLATAGVTRSVPGSAPVRVRCVPIARRTRAADPLGR